MHEQHCEMCGKAVRARPGISAKELRDVVWADHPQGGPKNLHVHIHQMNPQLAVHGLRIRGSRRDGYRLIEGVAPGGGG